VVTHFNGYGTVRGFMGDVEEARRRVGGSAEERIRSEMRAVMQQARQAGLQGEPAQDLAALSIAETLAGATLHFKPSSGPMESLGQVYRQEAPSCTPGRVSSWSDTGRFLAMDLIIDPADLDAGVGGVRAIEVELGLPPPAVVISGLTCGGVTSGSPNDLVGAPAAYLTNHGDGFVRDWTIHGGEIFAKTEWSRVNRMAPMTRLEDSGTATLRHTPLAVH